MTTHHVWRPRLERDLFLNPFAPVTQRNPNFERVNINDGEEEEGESSPEPTAEQKEQPAAPGQGPA